MQHSLVWELNEDLLVNNNLPTCLTCSPFNLLCYCSKCEAHRSDSGFFARIVSAVSAGSTNQRLRAWTWAMCISPNETQSQVKFLGERKQDTESLWGMGGVHNTQKLGPHFWSPLFLLHKGLVGFLNKLGSTICCERTCWEIWWFLHSRAEETCVSALCF